MNERLDGIRARIVRHRAERDAAHAAWCDRDPGDDASEESIWTAYLDARAAYERALEEWFIASTGAIAALEEEFRQTIAAIETRRAG